MERLRVLWASLWRSFRATEGMPEPKKASLAYLTIPEPAVLLLNLQIEGEFMRVQISRDQLAGIVVVGTRELLSTGGGR
jgi:hypothetical protein